MSEGQKRLRSLEEWQRDDTVRHIDRIAARVRELADEIERTKLSVERVGQPGYNSYSQAAADVLHAVATWYMNVHLEQVTLVAAQADVARANHE